MARLWQEKDSWTFANFCKIILWLEDQRTHYRYHAYRKRKYVRFAVNSAKSIPIVGISIIFSLLSDFFPFNSYNPEITRVPAKIRRRKLPETKIQYFLPAFRSGSNTIYLHVAIVILRIVHAAGVAAESWQFSIRKIQLEKLSNPWKKRKKIWCILKTDLLQLLRVERW